MTQKPKKSKESLAEKNERATRIAVEQEAARKTIRKKGRGLEPTHAVISCPDCAAKLLIGIDFLEHRV